MKSDTAEEQIKDFEEKFKKCLEIRDIAAGMLDMISAHTQDHQTKDLVKGVSRLLKSTDR